MKVKIGQDFYDKKNDTVYTNGEIADVKNETALWIVRHNLGHIIPNVKIEKPVKKNNKAIGKSRKDKMMRKSNIKHK